VRSRDLKSRVLGSGTTSAFKTLKSLRTNDQHIIVAGSYPPLIQGGHTLISVRVSCPTNYCCLLLAIGATQRHFHIAGWCWLTVVELHVLLRVVQSREELLPCLA
jgi:hypothetical protein